MKLEKCPFCGGKARMCSTGSHIAADRYFVSCGVCGVETPRIARVREEAITAWNRRAEVKNDPLTLDELRQMDGEPVWVETGEVSIGEQIIGNWQIIHSASDERVYFMGFGSGFRLSDYGKTWLAYRHKSKETSPWPDTARSAANCGKSASIIRERK